MLSLPGYFSQEVAILIFEAIVPYVGISKGKVIISHQVTLQSGQTAFNCILVGNTDGLVIKSGILKKKVKLKGICRKPERFLYGFKAS